MNFYRKPAFPLLLLGIGVLLFIFGLVSVYAVTGKTDEDLIKGFAQRIYLNRESPQTVYAAPNQPLNFHLVGPRSIDGQFSTDQLTIELYEPVQNKTHILYKEPSTNSPEPLFEDEGKLRESVLELSLDELPAQIEPGSQLEMRISGQYQYFIREDAERKTLTDELDLKTKVEVLPQAELLKVVRRRPNLIMAITFPLGLLLMAVGLKSELYGKKKAKSG